MIDKAETSSFSMMVNLFPQDDWTGMDSTLFSNLDVADSNIEMEDLEDRDKIPNQLPFPSPNHFPSPTSNPYPSASPNPLSSPYPSSSSYSGALSPSSSTDMFANSTSPAAAGRESSPCPPLVPIQRTRCNTWPRVLQQQEMIGEPTILEPVLGPGSQAGGSGYYSQQAFPAYSALPPPHLLPANQLPLLSEELLPANQLPLLSEEEYQQDKDVGQNSSGGPKHKVSRRNPWGSYSYADLITQAIQSAPDQRLTLSQIYDWLTTNIPFFKERADVSTSAGWKNSIRHNLSLHMKFVKVQNEGSGKSSWWTLAAPETSKSGPKIQRRRAASMESNKLKKEKERAISKMKARLERASSTNSSGSCSTGFSSTEPSSPTGLWSRGSEYRTRTNSSASSDCGIRPRTASDASPPPSLLDYSLTEFTRQICESPRTETDLDNIRLDNLYIQNGNIIREYLEPESGIEKSEHFPTSAQDNFKSWCSLDNAVSPSVNQTSCQLVSQSSAQLTSRHQKVASHKLTILEPRESSYNSDLSNLSYGLRNSFNSTSLPAVHVRTDLHKTSSNSSQEWMDGGVQEYRGLMCFDESQEREREIKRQEMIKKKIEELKLQDKSSDIDQQKSELMINILQEQLARKEMKHEQGGEICGPVSGERGPTTPAYFHEYAPTPSFPLYEQIKEEPGSYSELDESSILQIQNILDNLQPRSSSLAENLASSSPHSAARDTEGTDQMYDGGVQSTSTSSAQFNRNIKLEKQECGIGLEVSDTEGRRVFDGLSDGRAVSVISSSSSMQSTSNYSKSIISRYLSTPS